MDFGDKIRFYREQIGMTQDELAIRLGYKDRSSVAKVETGKSDLPVSKLMQYAQILNVNANDLLPKTTETIVTETEQRLLEKVRKLKDISVLETYIDFLIAQQNK